MVKADKAKARQFEELMKIISEARQIAKNVGVSKPGLFYKDAAVLDENKELVAFLGRLGEVKQVSDGQGIRLTGSRVTAWLDIDAQAAKSYLNKLKLRLEDQQVSIDTLQSRLANKAYMARAPKKLVEDTKNQLAQSKGSQEMIEIELKNFEKSLKL